MRIMSLTIPRKLSKSLATGTAALVLIGSAQVSTLAYAADHSEIAAVLVASTTDLLEISDSPDLERALIEDLIVALEDGELSEELTDEISDNLDEGISDPSIDDLLEDGIDDQIEEFEEQEPLWKAAFDQVKEDFRACRLASTTGAKDCARGLGFRLQVAKVTGELLAIEQALADIALLPEEEQQAALDELSGKQDSLQAKLTRMSAKLESLSLLANQSDLEGALDSFEQARSSSKKLADEIRGKDKASGNPSEGKKNDSDSANPDRGGDPASGSTGGKPPKKPNTDKPNKPKTPGNSDRNSKGNN